MKNYIVILLLLICTIASTSTYAQCNKNGGDQNGQQGSGGEGDDTNKDNGPDKEWTIRGVHSSDPNDILGPVGYAVKQWVSINDRMRYTIRFENNPAIASAPAQNVYVNLPVDPKIDINSLQLGGFGFGKYIFEVPANTTFYTRRLDVRDSLGLYVDITAGINVVKHEIFWIFKSIDPATGLAPTDAMKGFLALVDSNITRFNDTTVKDGEGYVTFSVKPDDASVTGDTATAKASIVFDTNEEIPTNTWVNTIDALPPVSAVSSFTASHDSIRLVWSGADDPGGSGVREYALYASQDSGAFTLYKVKIDTTTAVFPGVPGHQYRFFTIATDNTGNKEALKNSGEVTVNLSPCGPEICGNGIDDNCNGLVDEGCVTLITYYKDNDGDGFGNPAISVTAATQPAGFVLNNTDCNDGDNTVYPGAPEICDGKDNNCNGQTDEGITLITYYRDSDGDGFGDAGNSVQACSQPQGYVTNSTDCNDANAAIHAPVTYYRDVDGDGFGNPANSVTVCQLTPPQGYVSNNTDCNDTQVLYADADNDGYGAGAPAPCGVANNTDCNDNNAAIHSAITYYRDADGDGYGALLVTTTACSATPPTGYVSNSTDCNDADASIYPSAPELCDGKDNNCNGLVDDGVVGTVYYRDQDGDGFGNPAVSVTACTQPAGYVTNNTDCNDGNAALHSTVTYYRDADNDGFGNPLVTIAVCSTTAPAGYVANSTDCNDSDGTIYPGAPELCDGKDNNCVNGIDEGLPVKTWYRDGDNDGYGDPSTTIKSCNPPAGYVSNNDDCNDANPAVHPNATEICDGLDNDCDGKIDDKCVSQSLPKLTINDLVVYENVGQAMVTVSLNQPYTQTVTVKYAMANGTAQHPKDYVKGNGTLTFAPGATTAFIPVQIKLDSLTEGSEYFEISLSTPVNAAIIDGLGVVTILDPVTTLTRVDGTQGATVTETGFEVTAQPNPTNHYFTLVVQNASQSTVSYRVTDVLGRVVEKGSFNNSSLRMGEKYKAGIYVVELVKGDQVKVVKLVKQ